MNCMLTVHALAPLSAEQDRTYPCSEDGECITALVAAYGDEADTIIRNYTRSMRGPLPGKAACMLACPMHGAVCSAILI